jgi:hypothetical protein
MSQLTRRAFTQDMLGSLLTFSLLETVFSRGALAEDVKPVAAAWLARLDAMGRDLKQEKLGALEWQKQVEELFGQVELPELLTFIDFDKLTADVEFREQGERSLKATLPQVEGLPTELVFGHQVFALSKGRSVVPHGHDNMATAFLILKGDFQGRHYDRLDDEREHMIIRPTLDRAFKLGECSTVSDEKDNIHWFTATSETAFIFNIHVLNVVEGKKTGRVYLDPKGEELSDGRIRARKLKSAEAYKLYG